MPIHWPVPVGLIILLGASFYLFYPRIENFFVFFPQSSFDEAPERLGLECKDVYFLTDDGKRLHGWFFPLKGPSPVILFSHGNAGNISHRLFNVKHLLDKGLRVFIYDYRGYGRSEGRPSEEGIYRDGLAAYDHLVEKEGIPPGDIILFGRSLGAAVAIETALRKEVRSLIIESGFTSTRGMARTMVLFALFSPFMPANYNNVEKIVGVKVPKLIVHGDADGIVPFSMGEELFHAAKAPKYFYPLRGAGHNDTYLAGGERYFRTIAAFVRDSKV